MNPRCSLSIAVLLGAALGSAQAQPLPKPSVDYAGSARVSGAQGPVAVRHQLGLLRLEGNVQGQPLTVLVDLHQDSATVLTRFQGLPVALDIPPMGQAPIGMPRYDAIDAEPVGQARVAGEPCTVYRLRGLPGGPKVSGSACVTGDGILLKAEGTNPNGQPVRMEMTQVQRAPQDPALFQVPPGYQRLQIPALGALPGLPTLGQP
ncbi:MAG TPA: hypothetical protein VNN09_02785 [Candidatus Competibacteraceae bacterium]|nr:hypothetical protein [Candidatus Competibacteraceae bacterium]